MYICERDSIGGWELCCTVCTEILIETVKLCGFVARGGGADAGDS